VTIAEAARLVRAYEAIGIPVFLWGPPGLGKSGIVQQMCEQDGIENVDIRLALLNPVDLRGIPMIKGDKVEWIPPVFLTSKGACRFFLDELNVAPPTVQATAYQWTLDKRIGEWKMDTTWEPKMKRPRQTIIAAGNRSEDQALTYQMPAPLRNRLAHIQIEPDLDAWKDWAVQKRLNHVVINFLTYTSRVGVDVKGAEKSKYGLLYFFDKAQHAQSSFPTPRSWEMVAHFIDASPEYKTSTEALSGMIGTAVAVKFAAFVKIADQLPDADAIVRGKSNAPPPKAVDAAYAFAGALTAAVIRVKTQAERAEGTKVLAAYCVEHWGRQAEFAVLTMKDFGRTQEFRDVYRGIIGSKEWKDFTKSFGQLMETPT